MRINKLIAHRAGLSRREADDAISSGRVKVDGQIAALGLHVEEPSVVELDGKTLLEQAYKYIMLNKPVNYVCSRKKQDSNPTIYDLLPEEIKNLKTVGRLDKDSSGLILLTNDGDFAQQLTHPKYRKEKVYLATLNTPLDQNAIDSLEKGVETPEGTSRLNVTSSGDKDYVVTMSEGRNRQIRRTFGALNYDVLTLERIKFGDYELDGLKSGEWKEVASEV